MKKKLKKPFKIIFEIVSIIIITLILITLVESVYYYLYINNKDLFKYSKTTYKNHFFYKDNKLGSWILNNTSAVATKINGNKLIYNVTYYSDTYGRRKTPHTYKNKSIIFFGCSYTFGEGLEENQTLAYFLSNISNYKIYDYSLLGYSTASMLTHLQRNNFKNEIKYDNDYAFYIFMNDHVRRNIFDFKRYQYGGLSLPEYKIENNKLIYKGILIDLHPFISILYNILERSYFVRYYDLNFPKESEKDYILTAKIIEESKRIYEEKFNGTFYVIIHPFDYHSRVSKKLKKHLDKLNITVISFKLPENKTKKDYEIPNNGHPNELLNKWFAEQINNFIQNKTS